MRSLKVKLISRWGDAPWKFLRHFAVAFEQPCGGYVITEKNNDGQPREKRVDMLDPRWISHLTRDRTKKLDARRQHASDNSIGYCEVTDNCETFAWSIYIGWPLSIQTIIGVALLTCLVAITCSWAGLWRNVDQQKAQAIPPQDENRAGNPTLG